ncbi:MAG: NlpC/P60 family protein [Bacteroidota bacterium]|uniref:Glycoside hydrolase n=1 Tax=Pedobacter cryotolerans TaxID=2571270 RepID=A0A4U1CB69_9SPHI|nr:NlpC/P60 family protein [Pedobacter cryotolerans]RZL32353.1 MAG: glycoside hydrolase [Pedobacter sp.]TKC03286.1 glycoside hydrolase [Pedobacter cryotolerans]
MNKKFLFSTLIVLCSFSASFAQNKTKETNKLEDPDNLASQYFSQVMGVAVDATSNLKLYKFIYEWIGTPYRFGGNTKNGIDCSAFAKTIYQKVFNTTILRNSRDIFSMVDPLAKDELKEGDLVFFKIKSRSISHVGVYLGDNRFAHSSSGGVKISNLNEPYYSRYFYKGGRILDDAKKDFVEE